MQGRILPLIHLLVNINFPLSLDIKLTTIHSLQMPVEKQIYNTMSMRPAIATSILTNTYNENIRKAIMCNFSKSH